MAKAKPPIKHKDVYSLVNERITELLETGVIPWRQPWTNAGLPRNLITGKHYRGINVMLLASLHYPQNCFLTYKQVTELGGTVKKGEKSCPVIYWKWIEKENPDTKEKEKIPFLKYYNVFNVDQTEVIPEEKLPKIIDRQNSPIEACEKIITEMPNRPAIRHNEHRAYYNRVQDYINMPDMKSFHSSEGYYSVLLHELIHSTGHKNRLNRHELTESKGPTSREYAIEELTAEMGASYIKSYAGIPIEELENSAAYIKHWLERLKGDKKFIVNTSTKAQQATDYILNQKNIGLYTSLESDTTENRFSELISTRDKVTMPIEKHHLSK